MAKHSMLFFCFSGLQNVVKNGKTSTDILCPKALNVYPKPLDVRSELVNAHPKALNRDFAANISNCQGAVNHNSSTK